MTQALVQIRDGLIATLALVDAQLAAEATAATGLELPNPKAFFDHVRGRLWPRLTQAHVQGCERLISMCGRAGLSRADTAYVLATAYHETAYAMQPVREKGGDAYLAKYDTGRLAARLGNTPEADGDGQRFAGRGDVQLTGARNYAFANVRLHDFGILSGDESLTATPDLALRPDVSAAVIVYGMRDGWFTGRKLRDYLPASGSDTRAGFAKARAIVNGTDRADEIAGRAVIFQMALTHGGM